MASYLYAPVVVPFTGAAFIVILHILGLRKAQRGTSIAFAIGAVLASVLLLRVTTPVEQTYLTWASLADGRLPVAVGYQLDDLSRFFQVLPPLLALSVIIFDERASYVTHMLTFGLLGAGQSLVLANNLLLIYASWEVFLLLAAALLLHREGSPTKCAARSPVREAEAPIILAKARIQDPAKSAATWSEPESRLSSQELVSVLVLPHACGYLLLAAFLIVGLANDSLSVSKIQVNTTHGISLYLVSVSVLARITPFSLRVWPGLSAGSPAAVSFLSGGMTNWVAIYVFSRWIGITGASGDFPWALLTAAAAAAIIVLSISHAVRQSHITTMITSISLGQACLALFGLCLGDMQATSGAFFQLLGSSLLSVTLLLCARSVAKAVGTDALPRLHGLANALPVTAGMFLGATVLLAGIPLLGINFFAQWLIYESGLRDWFVVFVLASLAAGAGTFAVLVRAGFSAFLGSNSRFEGKEAREEGLLPSTALVPSRLSFASILGAGTPLVVACLAGLVPWLVYAKVVGPAAAFTVGSPAAVPSFLATLFPGRGGWTPYAVPVLMLLSALAGFALYYRGEMKEEAPLMVLEGGGGQIVEVPDHRGSERLHTQRGDLPGWLAAFVLRVVLTFTKAVGKLVASFEARYYVVTVLLCALLALFVLLE